MTFSDVLVPTVLRRGVALSVLVLAASLSAVGCGGSGPSKTEIAQERQRLTSIFTAQVVTRESQDALKTARADETKCQAQIGRALSLLDAQPQLWNRKEPSLGLVDVDTYQGKVDEIDTEMNRIPRGSLSQRCLKVLRSLTAAAENHKSALQDWSGCVLEYGIYCRLTIDDCAVEKHDESKCDSNVDPYTATQAELGVSNMRLTAEILLIDWRTARSRVAAAKKHLLGIGKTARPPDRPSPFIPRTDAEIASSLYGVTARLMCTRNVPQKAIDACQSLRDVLAGGISEDEESDLNEALAGIVTAYGLNGTTEPPATVTQTTS